MNINLTQYQVIRTIGDSVVVIAEGNLRQCWMYAANAYGDKVTVSDLLEKGININPARKEV